jgi:hypothetical protein
LPTGSRTHDRLIALDHTEEQPIPGSAAGVDRTALPPPRRSWLYDQIKLELNAANVRPARELRDITIPDVMGSVTGADGRSSEEHPRHGRRRRDDRPHPDRADRTDVVYDDGATQVFELAGATTYVEQNRQTRGKWYLDGGGHFCSFWPPTYRACYDLRWIVEDGRGTGLRFTELDRGSHFDGRYR